MSRFEREKAEIDGLYIDNDDIKDIAEDGEDILDDFGHMMDLDYPKTRKDLELDAAMRFSKPGRALEKTLTEDLSKIDFEGIERKMRGELKTCPFAQRIKKTG